MSFRNALMSRDSPGVWIAIFFAGGACLTVGAFAWRCVRCVRHIRRNRITDFDEAIRNRVTTLARRLKLLRTPGVVVSDVPFGPAIIGIFRPVIVLPRCLFEFPEGESICHAGNSPRDFPAARLSTFRVPLSSRESSPFLDPILAHELTHLRRGDLWIGLLKTITQCLWWFHPAVWIVSRQLEREAERCCDEEVLAEFGFTPGCYARSLLSVIECRQQLQPVPVFPGMRPVDVTRQRLERIMSLKNGLTRRTSTRLRLAMLALAAVVLPGAAFTAQENPAPVVGANLRQAPEATPAPPSVAPIVEATDLKLLTKEHDAHDVVQRIADQTGCSSERAILHLDGLLRSFLPIAIMDTEQGESPVSSRGGETLSVGSAQGPPCSMTVTRNLVELTHTEDGHAIVATELDRIRNHGLRKVIVSAKFVTGAVAEVQSLAKPFKLTVRSRDPNPAGSSPRQPLTPSPGNPVATEAGATVWKWGETAIVKDSDVTPVWRNVYERDDVLRVFLSRAVAFEGEFGDLKLGEAVPVRTGIQDSRAQLRILTDGLSLKIQPYLLDKGLIQIRCGATLESASYSFVDLTRQRHDQQNLDVSFTDLSEQRLQTTVELRNGQSLMLSGIRAGKNDSTEGCLCFVTAQVADESVVADAITNLKQNRPETPEVRAYAVADLLPVVHVKSKTDDASVVRGKTELFLAPVAFSRKSPPTTPVASNGQMPVPIATSGVDMAPIIELIKASVQPDSWQPAGRFQIASDDRTLCLVIRQTSAAHDQIANLLSQLRKSEGTMIELSCCLIGLTDAAFDELRQKHRFHAIPDNDTSHWALMAAGRGELLIKSLQEKHCDIVSMPRLLTIENQSGMAEVGQQNAESESISGFRLEMTPRILADSKLLRLTYAITIGSLTPNHAKSNTTSFESLLGDQQTLLITCERKELNPGDAKEGRENSRSRYLALVTPTIRAEVEERVVRTSSRPEVQPVATVDEPKQTVAPPVEP